MNKELIEVKYLAVLLAVHNRRAQTITCLSSLFAQRMSRSIRLDVFMVDDGSTDGTAEAVSLQFPSVNIIQGDGSLYWNRGMHRAWAVASQYRDYDYYMWLNDDTILVPNAIDELVSLDAIYNNMAIVVGATLSSKGDKITYGGRIGTQIAPCNGTSHEVERFNGNIVLIPQSVFRVLGNLDDYYTHSKGDFDYGIRAGKVGIKIFQCGCVLGVCDEHERIDPWCDPAIPLRKRWMLMHLPTGMPPHETFHYEKQINIWMAIFHFFTVYIRCLIPKIWIAREENLRKEGLSIKG